MPLSNQSTRILYAVLVLLFGWSLTAQITWSWLSLDQQAHESQDLTVPFYLEDYGRRITAIPAPYALSGLRVGDEVVALNGSPLESERQIDQIPRGLHPGSTLEVTVRRNKNDGASEQLTVPVRMTVQARPGPGWVFAICMNVVFPVSCLLVGFYIAFARPRDPLAWITMAMLVTFGHLGAGGMSPAVGSPLREMLLVYHPVTQTWPLWLLLFGLYFPIPFEYARRHSWTSWLPALPFVVLCGSEIYANLAADRHLSSIRDLAQIFHRMNVPMLVMYTVYITGFFALLGSKRHLLPTSDARRRMDVMITGCSLALLPLFPAALGEGGVIPRLPAWYVSIALPMLLLFPATMAYVIVVQQAMDVRMVVRLGVRYAIASKGLKILRIVLIIVIATITAKLATDSNHTGQAVIIAAAGTALIFGLRSLAERISHWMDRKFFREAYDAEVILTDLSNSVASIRDVRMIVETVARRIASSLHVEKLAVLLDRGGKFQPVYAMGYQNGLNVEFTRSASTMRLLRQMGSSPSKIYFDDPQSWVHGTPPSEQTALQSLGAEVLIPVTLKSRMLGLISLGPKRSEAPYSRVDLQLLGAVASQTGLALENAELTENIRREVAQRERLDRELEIAREVQQRLFPQNLPIVRGLDFAGYCRPALGVGGDYYDFIRLPEGCLGVAIGDVSGKGIAAALMMASLQASLRAQVIRPGGTLSEMIQHVNRLVYEASAANRYATFFYAQYDPSKRLLHYVNAGHNPPILYRRRSGGECVERMDAGGTVIGLFPEFPYEESAFELAGGDLFVAFTDGISEAMNHDDDEFGEDRLLEVIRQCHCRSAAETISCIIDRVDQFTAGAPQHDDMTLLVMRLE